MAFVTKLSTGPVLPVVPGYPPAALSTVGKAAARGAESGKSRGQAVYCAWTGGGQRSGVHCCRADTDQRAAHLLGK